MATYAQASLLSPVLRLIPARVLTALDAWSYRIARKHAERRRLAASERQRKAAAVIAQRKAQPRSD